MPVTPQDAVPIPVRRTSRLYRRLSLGMLRLEARTRVRGTRRAQRIAHVIWGAVLVLGAVLTFGPVIAPPLGLDDLYAAAEDFDATWHAQDFSADYRLSTDDEGRAVLEVAERIDLFVPEDATVSTLVRTVVSELEGQSLRPEVISASFDGTAVETFLVSRGTRVDVRFDVPGPITGRHSVELRYRVHDPLFARTDPSSGAEVQTLDWDAFGVDWPHGTAAKSLTLTLAPEFVDATQRAPRATLFWSILGESVALEPEPLPDGAQMYSATNDQNLPPYASFRVSADFADGTVPLPPPSLLFWVFAIGPFVPLLGLLVMLLLTLAARAVAWADARGRQWYIAQWDAPVGVDADVAAHVWGAGRAAVLAGMIERYQHRRTAPRAPGLSDFGPALGRLRWGAAPLFTDRSAMQQYTQGYRTSTAGIVRTHLTGAAMTLPILQLGVVRQLADRVPATQYWWPGAVLTLSVVVAVIALVIMALRRPLTRRGALLREHLRGMSEYLAQTRAEQNTSLKDPLLPYLAFLLPPRRAAEVVRSAIAQSAPEVVLARLNTFGHLTGARIAIRALALVLPVIALVVVTTVPSPTTGEPRSVYDESIAGDYGVGVQSIDAVARVVPNDDTLALEVTETLRVEVLDRFTVPQIVREWHARTGGIDRGIRDVRIAVDGERVPVRTGTSDANDWARSQVSSDWPGTHDVTVQYRVDNAVGTEPDGDGAWVDRLQWNAIGAGWRWDLSVTDTEVQRVGLRLEVPASLLGDLAIVQLDSTDPEGRRLLPATTSREGGTVIATASLDTQDDSVFSYALDNGDAGFRIDFAEGTFATGGRGAAIAHQVWVATPGILIATSLLLGFGACAVGILLVPRRRSGVLRDVGRWMPASCAFMAMMFFVWMTSDWGESDNPETFIGVGLLVLLMLAGGIGMPIWIAKKVPETMRTSFGMSSGKADSIEVRDADS